MDIALRLFASIGLVALAVSLAFAVIWYGDWLD